MSGVLHLLKLSDKALLTVVHWCITLPPSLIIMPFANPFTRLTSRQPGSQRGQGHPDADTAYAAAITALDIAKEVGGLLKDIPYVKGIAGTVLQILKIKDVSLHPGCFDFAHS